MKILDTNILICSTNEADQHRECVVDWLEKTLNGRESVGFPWIAITGFVRIATHPKIYERPHTIGEAVSQVSA